MTVSYRLSQFDAWVISEHGDEPGRPTAPPARERRVTETTGRRGPGDEGLVRDRHVLGEIALARLGVAPDLPLRGLGGAQEMKFMSARAFTVQ